MWGDLIGEIICLKVWGAVENAKQVMGWEWSYGVLLELAGYDRGVGSTVAIER